MRHAARITPPLLLALAALAACASRSAPRPTRAAPPGQTQQQPSSANAAPRERRPAPRNRTAAVAHVFVALCDNVNQGIVPVPARLGDGLDPQRNLYWGAAFGVKTFFKRSRDWQLVAEFQRPREAVLERLVFRHRARPDTYLVADAYRGDRIETCTLDFLEAASGSAGDALTFNVDGKAVSFHADGSAALAAYVGHDGLMDFQLPYLPRRKDDAPRDAVVLACASKSYFAPALREAGANPLLWTTNLMAPEAYVLDAALAGWLARESGEQVRARAAAAYHKYQRCGLRAAGKLFATGF